MGLEEFSSFDVAFINPSVSWFMTGSKEGGIHAINSLFDV